MFCPNCGTENAQGSAYCVNCATPLNGNGAANTGATGNPVVGGPAKSKLICGLLALFLGTLGVHNFYMGYTKKGLTQLLVSLVGGMFSCGIATIVIAIWSFIEAIQIFCGTINVDANGVPLSN